VILAKQSYPEPFITSTNYEINAIVAFIEMLYDIRMNKTNSSSYVYFALKGDDFDPQVVTNKLGIEPTANWKAGDK
jgi:hypothetical protein